MHRRTWKAVLVLLVAAFLAASGTVYAYYAQNIYNSSYNNTESMHCWCVPASTRTWLLYQTGSAQSESTIESYEQTKNKYESIWLTQKCTDGSVGNDPRGWAWGMKNYAPAYGFNDYPAGSQPSSTTQASMDWELVYGIRATGVPDGALVANGRHAIDVVGYETVNDPFSISQQTLNGFYIVDPWWGINLKSGLPGWPTASPYAYHPDYYFTISYWNAYIFTKNTNDGTFWYNKYTVVLRASTTANPSDTPPETYGDYVYNQMFGPIPAVLASDQSLAAPTVDPTIQQAVSDGLALNHLSAGDQLGVNLRGYQLGSRVHVQSLDPAMPSYDLVGLRVGGLLTAVAMVSDVGTTYEFAGLTTNVDGFRMATAADQLLPGAGMTGTPRLVWGWSDEGASPFAPFIEAHDAATGAPAYLTLSGKLNELHLVGAQG